MVTAAIFGLLVLLMLLGLPIAVSMGLTAVMSFLALGTPNLLMMVPQRMYAGTTSFTLLAIPFFILAGNLMNTGGMTARLVRFAQCLVGHIRGGLGHVTVVTNMIMAGMSGAAVADAVGTGNILIPAMEKAGYPRVFSTALVKELWPYIMALTVCLALITYIPWLVLWIPNLVMGVSR